MKTVYAVYKMEWPKDEEHSLDKLFASKEDAEKYCEEKEKKAAKKGLRYFELSEWYVEPMEVY